MMVRIIASFVELEQRIEELKQQLREKETKLKKYEILIRTNLNNVDGQYYNNPGISLSSQK